MPASAWLGLLFLGLLITPFAWAYQNLALRRFDASQVATFSNASPILTVVWGMWLFGEVLTPTLIAGGAMTLGGIYWACRPRNKGSRANAARRSGVIRRSVESSERIPALAWAGAGQRGGHADERPACLARGGLAVYVTSHGFGHLNRTAAVLNRVPADVPITIKSNPNLFVHWRERLRRPAELQSFVSDVGAVNPPGDSAATDGAATIALAARVHAEALLRLDDEVQRLVEQENAAVLCDAPALPLLAAKRAGIPGFLMANFTWADIYAPYARKAGGDAMEFVRRLREVYRSATATFRVAPALRMSWLSPVHDMRDGRQPGEGPPRRIAAIAGPQEIGQAGLLVCWAIRPERPRLAATGRATARAACIS